MISIRSQNDNEFDISKVKQSAEAYSRSVGTGCRVLDATGHTIHDAGGKGECVFCKKVNGLAELAQNCQNAHLYGSYQAERFGGRYIFFCPVGLVHWISPIIYNSAMKGALLGGPVLMVEPEEFLLEEIMANIHIDMKTIQELKQYIKGIPIVKSNIVNDLSELLYIVSVHCSDDSLPKNQEDMDYQEHQLEISKYIHHISTMGGTLDKTKSYPIEKEKELISLITGGDKAGSQKVLNEILGFIFFSTGGNFEVIKARILELIVLLSRAALEGGADVEQIFGLNYKYLSQIHNFKTVDDLSFWLSEIMARFTDCVFNLTDVKHIDIIYKAMDYIKRNYMKKITLDEVASHVYISTSYFSVLFNTEMKCNFNTYVNRIRIDVSKKLLLDDTLSLADVAEYVGYEDQSYFTKVFKNIVGISPGRYKEGRGR